MKPALQRVFLLAAVAGLLSACVSSPEVAPGSIPSRLTPFSASRPGEPLPPGWGSWVMSRFGTLSRYELVEDGGTTVLKGIAKKDSASGLLHLVDLDPRERPIFSWRWKVMDLAPSQASPDDSPVRILVSFEGDYGKLPFGDRIFYDQFRLFNGQQLPYAGVMYVWGSRTPRGGVAPNKYTSRIKMIAVESGREKLGQWLEESRNVEEDYRRLFGEEPGRVVSVGLMTEADGSDRALEAYYGDIRFAAPGDCCSASAMRDK